MGLTVPPGASGVDLIKIGSIFQAPGGNRIYLFEAPGGNCAAVPSIFETPGGTHRSGSVAAKAHMPPQRVMYEVGGNARPSVAH